MKITIFEGDITEAPAEAVCTSTNPRLSLMMGTGSSVRERGGFTVLRACEEIVAASGSHALPVGSVHVTTAANRTAHRRRLVKRIITALRPPGGARFPR